VSTVISGRDLLTLVKENPEAGQQELAAMAGYTRTNRKGQEVISIDAFKDALLEAKGVSIKSEVRGRAAANETTVHAAGGILIGSIYAKMAGVGPGDVYSITVSAETGQIVLDVISRVEGSPRPFKVYERTLKAKDTAELSTEPVAA
jgi:hypothetical protein